MIQYFFQRGLSKRQCMHQNSSKNGDNVNEFFSNLKNKRKTEPDLSVIIMCPSILVCFL